MGKARILIVEDDPDISEMLNIFFGAQGYEVEVAGRGNLALEKTRQNLPHLIVLDIMLPDIDGYEVCRQLRTNIRTSHIPIIFLTQKDERSDKLQGLELGADDYITKPFDIEELKLRVQNAIARAERDSLTDPRSGLPSGRLIEDQLREIIRRDGWSYLDVRINFFEAFSDVYGFVAADNVIRFTTLLLGEVVDEFGSPKDFIGHPGGNSFVIITDEANAAQIMNGIKARFKEQVLSHYNFIDRENGYIQTTNEAGKQENIPLMNISIGSISPREYPISDIREITELAAEARRKDMQTT
ncbi:MAG: response regulator [Anaerolineales bacterium]|jgi:PleD family two-component response regulator